MARDIAKRISERDKLVVSGLHCHIGTFILDPEAYVREVEKMISFAYLIG